MDDLKTLPERFRALAMDAARHHGESHFASDTLELAHYAVEQQKRAEELKGLDQRRADALHSALYPAGGTHEGFAVEIEQVRRLGVEVREQEERENEGIAATVLEKLLKLEGEGMAKQARGTADVLETFEAIRVLTGAVDALSRIPARVSEKEVGWTLEVALNQLTVEFKSLHRPCSRDGG